jgi:GrpB-like predicted nucleotidyltransferase (UPF0157 family)
MFEAEKRALFGALESVDPVIEHMGSTSVPNLIAKPIIDIMIGLPDFSAADSLVPVIRHMGYTYYPQYEDVMPYRRFFKKVNAEGETTHHIHMVQKDTEFWIRHLQFRDYLRLHSETADEYGLLKQQLAEQNWADTNDYADAKTDFIRAVEKKAADFFNKPVT